jgi:hypothetical protein
VVLSLALGSLLIAADVAIHIEAIELFEPARETMLLARLDGAIRATGASPVIDAERGPCPADRDCSSAIRTRTGASQVLFLRVFEGSTRIRVLGTLASPTGPGRLDVDLSRDPETWSTDLTSAARVVFGASATPTAENRGELAHSSPLPASDRSSLLPWIVLAGGTAAIAGGVGFAISADRERDLLSAGFHRPPEVAAISSTMSLRSGVSGALIAVGVAALLIAGAELVF